MYSFAWPDMVKNTSANIIENHPATVSNLKLMLLSNKKSLLGDPYYGTNLKKLIFEQNNQILKDLIIDDVYTSILTFMPQLVLSRNDITITSDKHKVYINIKATNVLDYTTNLYNITLTEGEEL